MSVSIQTMVTESGTLRLCGTCRKDSQLLAGQTVIEEVSSFVGTCDDCGIMGSTTREIYLTCDPNSLSSNEQEEL